MRILVFLGVVASTLFAKADDRKDFSIARGQAAEKLILKDYAGAREAVGRALTLAGDDGEREDAYRMLGAIAAKTGDVPAMTETIVFELPRTSKRSVRAEKLKRYVAFLRAHKALETAVSRSRDKLAESPEDIVALGVLVFSVDRAKSNEAEAVDLSKRFEAANLKLAERQAQESEELAPRLNEAAAMGYASAAKAWADTENTERVHLMLKKAAEAPALTDSFMLRLQHENSGDALCLIGLVEEGVTRYEEAIKVEDTEGQKTWLRGKINDVRKGKKPVP